MQAKDSRPVLRKRYREWCIYFVLLCVTVLCLGYYLVGRTLATNPYCWPSLGLALVVIPFLFLLGHGITSSRMKQAAKCVKSGVKTPVPYELRLLVGRYRRKHKSAGEVEVHIIPKNDKTPPDYSAHMMDHVSGTDHLFFTSELWDLLDSKEREQLIAHETAHEDRLENHLTHFVDCIAGGLLFLVICCGVVAFAFNDVLPFLLYMALPFVIVRIVGEMIHARLSKVVEFITDVRTIEATGDTESFASMLRKIDAAEAEVNPHIAKVRPWWIVRILDSHPLTEDRIANVKEAF